MPPRLNTINLLTYVANLLVTYGSQLGWFGLTNQEQSLKYQTLVTPIGFAFAIWGPIFLLQGIFAVAQIMPRYRSLHVVRDGVSFWYVAVCAAQAGWTVAFAQDVIWLSIVFMLLILGSLAALNWSVVRVVCHPCSNSADEEAMAPALCYLFFRAPFLMHLGWITAATFVNANVLLVKYAAGAHELQLGAAIASIALLMLPGLYNPATSATLASDPLYTLVLSWAFFGVHSELAKPTLEGSLPTWCPSLVSNALSGVAALMAAGLLATALGRLVVCARRTPRTAEITGEGAGQAMAPVYPRFVERSDGEKPAGQGNI